MIEGDTQGHTAFVYGRLAESSILLGNTGVRPNLQIKQGEIGGNPIYKTDKGKTGVVDIT